jgi:hypothetical protein
MNSVRSDLIVFHTIHTYIYLFWFSKCMSNLKLQIFVLAYVTLMCFIIFFKIFEHVLSFQKS